jgi:hypothetical protein
VSDRTSIAAALSAIASDLISCTVSLVLSGDEDPSRMRVEVVIDGVSTPIPPGGWSFDPGASTVTLLGGACMVLQDASRAGRAASVRVRVACATMCVPSVEVCDYVDNDCDGMIDEGCTPCPDETCDGVDNDCDGVIDEGCPPPSCLPAPETCDGVDNDCDGVIDEGCPPPCVPAVEVCNGVDDDCDGMIDEGCVPGCVPSAEVCDRMDNDCDGLVDEGCPIGPG